MFEVVMKRSLQGHYERSTTAGESVSAFVPAALPPRPPIEWTPELRETFDRALIALGRLDGISDLLPDSSLFLYLYIRKEAVLSSMIEGTQSSLSDLLRFEVEPLHGDRSGDVQEVVRYVAALEHGLRRLEEGFPLSLRLIREIHRILLTSGRGNDKSPGDFRTSQNWIGGTRPSNAFFVPPPPDKVLACMGDLENFIHDSPDSSPVLLKAALTHVQFETIHPFLDGNGRLGRLLITLLLCEREVLHQPLLYLSLYFKTHRTRYYELLDVVRRTGDWEAWLSFFADAVIATAEQAADSIRRVHALLEEDRARLASFGRMSGTLQSLHGAFQRHLLATPYLLGKETGLSQPTVNKGLLVLVGLGMVHETTDRKRGRIFQYTEYLKIMEQGMELPV
jgi:Fic family protein